MCAFPFLEEGKWQVELECDRQRVAHSLINEWVGESEFGEFTSVKFIKSIKFIGFVPSASRAACDARCSDCEVFSRMVMPLANCMRLSKRLPSDVLGMSTLTLGPPMSWPGLVRQFVLNSFHPLFTSANVLYISRFAMNGVSFSSRLICLISSSPSLRKLLSTPSAGGRSENRDYF